MNKSRDVSVYDFLELLQEEYIVAVIRGKIYPRKNDKKYYDKVASGKRKKIIDIAERNSLPTIFDDKGNYTEFWKRVVNNFGFPNFIYNQDYNDGNQNFPYKGTIVEVTGCDDFQYAVSHFVDFENKIVEVTEQDGGDDIYSFHYKDVRKLTLEETDKMFYYHAGNEFKVRDNEGKVSIGVLTSYDFDRNIAWIRLKGGTFALPYPQGDVSRIL